MAWIELHQEFRDHPKVARLAVKLNISYPLAQACLINLWLWTCAYAKDGDLSRFTPKEIADAAKSEIEPKRFVAAMIEARWLDKNGAKVTVHDWNKHGLRFLKDSQQRQAKSRQNKKLKDDLIPSLSRDGHVLLTIHTNLNIPTNHTLRSDAFFEVWEEWLQFRAFEKKDPVTPIAAKKQIKFLLTQSDPIAVVEHAIAHQWRGLFPIRENGQIQAATYVKKQKKPEYCAIHKIHHKELLCPKCFNRTDA